MFEISKSGRTRGVTPHHDQRDRALKDILRR